jgi:ABC-type polysaccharide/polyol phosphate transport system ATPase subunit
MAVIEVRDVWKKYRLYYDKGSTLKEKLLFRNRNHYEERWVLKGIDLSIEKGQTLGLLGENGSGKSTLLKLLTRISYPNRGEIEIHGKVSSLLELGAGFHPDMTGRENIYINASIFGLTREEIDEKLGKIIAFSELDDFIDNPVRTYSSGMYMRLAFSVAINVDADILMIDEILAVGDLNFQKKCFKKLQQLKQDGVTIILVSHDLDSIEKLCDTALWIRDGKAEEFGSAMTVCKKYLQYMLLKDERALEQDNRQLREKLKEEAEDRLRADDAEARVVSPDDAMSEDAGSAETRQESSHGDDTQPNVQEKEEGVAAHQDPAKARKGDRWGNQDILLTDVILEGSEGREHYSFDTNDALKVRIRYKRNRVSGTLGFGIAIYRADGVYCYGTNTFIDKHPVDKDELGESGEVCCVLEPIGLIPGTYSLNVAAHDENGLAYDYRIGVLEFNIHSEIRDEGVYRPPHRWQINGGSGADNEKR